MKYDFFKANAFLSRPFTHLKTIGLKSFAMDDTNTHVAFSRGYRDTKVTSAFMPVTQGFGTNSADHRVMDEAGVDGLLTMTLDLTIGSDGKLVLMTPRFGFEINGKLHAPLADTK